MYVCICKGIKESDVRELGQAAITCPKKLADSLGLNDKKHCCGRCVKNISKFVALAVEEATFLKSPMMS
jgi:bacterioferritin-associated ferredoxin